MGSGNRHWQETLVYPRIAPSLNTPSRTRDDRVDKKQPDDASLIREIGEGREAALAELYDRYGRLLFSIAHQMVGNRESAEEITLDVFNRVWQKAQTYRPEKSQVNTWLTRMTRNRAIDVLRREKVRPERTSVSWAEVYQEPRVEGQNPESYTSLMMQQEHVRQAVASLPPAQREALALAYFQGLSQRQIAERLDQPLGTVKGRIRAAMYRLRSQLVDVGVNEDQVTP
jgi:RNA polymerase sigma-70 factor (ECF subfamily)